MKKILLAVASVVLLAGCEKQAVTPVAQENPTTRAAGKGATVNGDYTTYCYTTTQTSSDSWTLRVYQNLGALSMVAVYYIQYDLNGVPTGWLPVTSFPYAIGTGLGAGVSNIRIKETRCFSSPFGTSCSDTFYTVSPC